MPGFLRCLRPVLFFLSLKKMDSTHQIITRFSGCVIVGHLCWTFWNLIQKQRPMPIALYFLRCYLYIGYQWLQVNICFALLRSHFVSFKLFVLHYFLVLLNWKHVFALLLYCWILGWLRRSMFFESTIFSNRFILPRLAVDQDLIP